MTKVAKAEDQPDTVTIQCGRTIGSGTIAVHV